MTSDFQNRFGLKDESENRFIGEVESETEDEEVAMNCVGGFRGIEDSDINSTDMSSDEEDPEDE